MPNFQRGAARPQASPANHCPRPAPRSPSPRSPGALLRPSPCAAPVGIAVPPRRCCLASTSAAPSPPRLDCSIAVAALASGRRLDHSRPALAPLPITVVAPCRRRRRRHPSLVAAVPSPQRRPHCLAPRRRPCRLLAANSTTAASRPPHPLSPACSPLATANTLPPRHPLVAAPRPTHHRCTAVPRAPRRRCSARLRARNHPRAGYQRCAAWRANF